MLSYLRILNLALVEDVALDLSEGLTVLTGETGAGKSIVLDGLALVTGERASIDKVRRGAAEATIEAVFIGTRDPEVRRSLEESGLALEKGMILVRRVVGSGTMRAYVNDRVVTVQRLREIGQCLVDLVGQHEQHSLRRSAAHRELLDRFSENGELLRDVEAAWVNSCELQEKINALEDDDRVRVQRADYLRYRVNEIAAARLHPDEGELLAAERRRLVHAEQLASGSEVLVQELYESDSAVSMVLGRAVQQLARLRELDPDLPASETDLDNARAQIEEAARALQGYMHGIEADPSRLAEVEERLATIERLQRKYGGSITEILESSAAAQSEFVKLESSEEHVASLRTALEAAVEAYGESAAVLTQRREEAAVRLEERIEGELAQVGMRGARFRVGFRIGETERTTGLPAGASRHGNEGVEFCLAANPGETACPIAKVASGGELSRVLLSLKLVATEGDPLETMVFDEVDAGIGGGGVAERLGQRLADLSRSHQVIVVTHLPQVAAYADRHFRVQKVEEEGRRRVQVEVLDEGARVEELARMLGGVEITETTRSHAREMLSVRN